MNNAVCEKIINYLNVHIENNFPWNISQNNMAHTCIVVYGKNMAEKNERKMYVGDTHQCEQDVIVFTSFATKQGKRLARKSLATAGTDRKKSRKYLFPVACLLIICLWGSFDR